MKNCVSNVQCIEGVRLYYTICATCFTLCDTNSDHAVSTSTQKCCTLEEVQDIYIHLFRANI